MAHVLNLATVADNITLIRTGYSFCQISAVPSPDRGTVAKYRRQLQAEESRTPDLAFHARLMELALQLGNATLGGRAAGSVSGALDRFSGRRDFSRSG